MSQSNELEMVMTSRIGFVRFLLLWFVLSTEIFAQAQKDAPGAPPKVLLVVYQQTLPGKAGERQRLEVETSRRFDELDVPITWIELEAVTGPPQALFFDPADSFAELDRAGAMLARTFATYPELAEQQQQIEERLSSSKTVVAVRRDELGYNPERMDLSKARYLRISVVSLRTGHERDFAEAWKILASPPGVDRASVMSAVYEVNSGMPQPTFLVVESLRSLADADRRLDTDRHAQQNLSETERSRVEQIGREAYVSVESNLYAVHPEMSHVSKEFASGDPAFWKPTPK
jgi:hypothetical protein